LPDDAGPHATDATFTQISICREQFCHRVRNLGIEEMRKAPQSPRQNPFATP